jgi:hypothetical protein
MLAGVLFKFIEILLVAFLWLTATRGLTSFVVGLLLVAAPHLIGLAVFLFSVWVVTRRYHVEGLSAWFSRHQSLRQALSEVRQFRSGAAALFHLRRGDRGLAFG